MKILAPPPTGKRHLVLLLLLLLCCVKTAWADDELSATIHVEQAGTLSSMMGTTKKNSITDLTLTGELNTADFQFIREMAGCYIQWTKQPGKLRHLDLSGARLVTSGNIWIYHTTESHWNDFLVKIDTPQEFPELLEYLDQLQTVVLPSNLTKLGDFAFNYCTNLQSIGLPSRLKEIGSAVFQRCKKLSNITLPQNLNSIGEWAFNGCESLTSVTMPSEITTIPLRAFSECTNLETINLPSTITSIGDYAFRGCKNLEMRYLPTGIKTIGYSAFSGCSKISLLSLPNGVKEIDSYAFESCTGLTHITIQNGVTSVSNSLFQGCTNLQSVIFNGRLSNISANAFYGCNSLSLLKVSGYDNITSIGDNAFYGCSSLPSFEIPSTTTDIGSSAFYGCKGLKTIHLSAAITSIGSSAFSGCTNLQSIFADMPSPLNLDASTFNNVDKKTCTLYVPQGKYQTYWLADVWGDFSNIIDSSSGTIDEQVSVNVTTAGTLESLLGSMKWHVTDLKISGTLNIYDIQCIREMAGCYYNTNGSKYTGNLHHLDLAHATYSAGGPYLKVYNPGGSVDMFIASGDNGIVTDALFGYLDGLQTVKLPPMWSTGDYTFMHCPNLISVTIPYGVKNIGISTFNACI